MDLAHRNAPSEDQGLVVLDSKHARKMRCRFIAVSQEANPAVWGAIGHSSSIPWSYVVQAVDPFAKAARALSTLMSAETREKLITIYDDLRCYTPEQQT